MFITNVYSWKIFQVCVEGKRRSWFNDYDIHRIWICQTSLGKVRIRVQNRIRMYIRDFKRFLLLSGIYILFKSAGEFYQNLMLPVYTVMSFWFSIFSDFCHLSGSILLNVSLIDMPFLILICCWYLVDSICM
jgi:hypothetical protein